MNRLFCFLLWTTLVFGVQANAQEITGPIAVEASAEDDARIANRLREILGELDNFGDISVEVNEGVVTFQGTTETAADASQLTSLASRISGVAAVKNEVTETADIGRRLDPAWDRFQARVDQIIVKLPLVLIAAAAFAIVAFAGYMISKARWPWDQIAPNAFIANIYRQLVRLAFVVLAIVLALDILNATALLSTILGAAGIVGLAVGFAVRDTVENFIASVLLSFRQPFSPNDVIEINGDEGKVIRLTSRATILLSFDGNQIRIPNATVYKSRIVNYSKNAERRFKFSFLVDRDADLSATKQAMIETVKSLPFVIAAPAPTGWIDKIEPAGAVITVTGWVNQNETSLTLAKSEAQRLVKKALKSAGVGLVDATQVVETKIIEPQRPLDSEDADNETTEVADVQSTDEDALDHIIDEERAQGDIENLLKEGAPTE